ncbi:MAG: hypothetical protein U1F27_06295 [Turneriella sp.]
MAIIKSREELSAYFAQAPLPAIIRNHPRDENTEFSTYGCLMKIKDRFLPSPISVSLADG